MVGPSSSSTGGDRYVKIYITGNATSAIKAMRDTGSAAKETESALTKSGKSMQAAGSRISSFGHSLAAVSLPLALVGGYAIKSAMSFQSSMTLLQTQAGMSAKEVKRLESSVLGLAGKTAQSPEELAKGMYPIASVGLRGAKALEALKASAIGARVGNASLTETANAVAGAMRVQMRDVHGAGDAMSVMSQIVGLGKMKMEDLTGAMATGILPQAKLVGLGFRDVGAALDAMTRQGVPASTEATRLRMNLTQMVAPSGAALKALHSIGLEQFSLAKAMHGPQGLVEALALLRSHLSGLSSERQALVLSEAFGKSRGSANILGLLNALPEMEKIRTQLNKAGGKQLEQAWGATQKDSAVKMAKALDGLKAALITFGGVLIPVVIPAIEKLAKAVEKVTDWFGKLPKPLRDAGVYFGLFLVAASPLIIFFGRLLSAGGAVLAFLGKLGPKIGAAAGEADAGAAAAGTGLGVTLGEALVIAAAGYVAFKLGDELGKALKKKVHISLNLGSLGADVGDVATGQFSQLTNPFKVQSASSYHHHLAVEHKQAEVRINQRLENMNPVRQIEQKWAEQPIHITVQSVLDGKVVAESNAKHVRDNPQGKAAKWNAEAAHKTVATVAARG